MHGRFAHVTGLRMYAGSGCPVQQTKWYRGVFHTQCAVYVKAFVFDGSSQMERTQEDEAFFYTLPPPMPLTFAGCQKGKR